MSNTIVNSDAPDVGNFIVLNDFNQHIKETGTTAPFEVGTSDLGQNPNFQLNYISPISYKAYKKERGSCYDNRGTLEGEYETSPDEYYNQQETEYTIYTDYVDRKYIDPADIALQATGEEGGQYISTAEKPKSTEELTTFEIPGVWSTMMIWSLVSAVVLAVSVVAVLGGLLASLRGDLDALQKDAKDVSNGYESLSAMVNYVPDGVKKHVLLYPEHSQNVKIACTNKTKTMISWIFQITIFLWFLI